MRRVVQDGHTPRHLHEYHALLKNPQQFQYKEYSSESGELNPFLHLMMHLTMEEQISINQPPGIANLFKRLTRHYHNEHDALHRMMDAWVKCCGKRSAMARGRTQKFILHAWKIFKRPKS